MLSDRDQLVQQHRELVIEHAKDTNEFRVRLRQQAATHMEELAAKDKSHQALMSRQALEHAEELAAKEEEHKTELSELKSKITELQSLVDALGGTEEGQKLLKKKLLENSKNVIARCQEEIEKQQEICAKLAI